MHLQAGIVDDEASAWRERDRLVDRRQPLAKQLVIVIEPSPSLTVIRVGDVELDLRVALGRVRAQERRPRLRESIRRAARIKTGQEQVAAAPPPGIGPEDAARAVPSLRPPPPAPPRRR